MELGLLLVGLAVLLFLAFIFTSYQNYSKKHLFVASIPKATPCLPLVGNAFHLDMNKCHQVLAEWSKQSGPVFYIQLFREDILVLNDYASIHDALIVQGSAFAGRPPMYRTKHADRDKHSVVWQTYTDKLVFLRKEVLRSLRMYGSGLEELEEKCKPEILSLIRVIASTDAKAFDPCNVIYNAVCNVMLCLTLGKRLDYSCASFQHIRTMSRLFNDSFGSGLAKCLDFLPFMRFLQAGYFGSLKEALKLRDEFWNEQLSKLKETPEDKRCVVHHLLGLQNASSPDFPFKSSGVKKNSKSDDDHLDISTQTVKEVFTNLILAGTDTTSTALTCLLLLLLHYPEIQNRLWQEINEGIGIDRLPSLADRNALPFMEATLLELLRYISHIPLSVPHYTTCDTTVLGKPVPVNTTVYINLWSMHHDEAAWPDPWKFDPTRFLDVEGKLLPPSHENRRKLLPFGAGRRVCLGESLAKNRLFLFATSLVQNFQFEAENAERLPEADPRTYEMGLVLHPKAFTLRAIKREKC